MLLDITNLNVKLRGRLILKDISVKVKTNEIVALLGANASGKTTTLKSILGLIRPLSGSVKFRGKEIIGLSPEKVVRAGIAIVPENHRLFPRLSVEENLLVVLPKNVNYREKLKAFDEIKEVFPLFRNNARWSQLAGTLSGGEQQQVAFARALLLKPKLLLLDEPSIGMSAKLVQGNFRILKKLRDMDISTLVVEQYVKMILEISDRGYVLQEGRIIAEDVCENLVNSDLIKHAYMGEFVE